MRKYRVEITRVAEFDIQEIFEYISRDNKAAAIKWVDEIERQIDRLENNPIWDLGVRLSDFYFLTDYQIPGSPSPG